MAIDDIISRWKLPKDYMEFLQANADSLFFDTEDYGELEIFGAQTLIRGQDGYSYNPVTKEPIDDWNPDMVVIASAWGDAFCIDLSKENSPVYFSFHGEGEWDFSEEYESIRIFLDEWIK